MKTIIAGSRTILDYRTVENYIENCPIDISEIVCGGAVGVDSLGRMWAEENGIEVTTFLPNWNLYGKKAGILRNIEMGNYADALIALWDGQSRGTEHMIKYAKQVGLKVYVYKLTNKP